MIVSVPPAPLLAVILVGFMYVALIGLQQQQLLTQQQQRQQLPLPLQQQQQVSPAEPQPLLDDWCQRSRLLVGADGLEKLAAVNVLLVGVGGVGSFAGVCVGGQCCGSLVPSVFPC